MFRKAAFLLLLIVAAGSTYAQWRVINLHPAGASRSFAFGVSGGQQVGRVDTGVTGIQRASLWTGTAASWVDLSPAGSTGSQVLAVDGGRQGGFAIFDHREHASLWSGTAASWVDLSPPGANNSYVYGVDAGQQVGYATPISRAILWNGTAGSWMVLPPAEYASRAYTVGGGQVAGIVTINFYQHASLWNGTGKSWVDLQPAGVNNSLVFGVQAGQQVGMAAGPWGEVWHASLWGGTAASWVDLNPPGAYYSIAHGVHEGRQVGEANVGGVTRAVLWKGSATTWVDLHAALPASFSLSTAEAIRHSAPFTYVVGWGSNDATQRIEALMWVGWGDSQTITASATTLNTGIVVSGTAFDLNASDDMYYTLRPGIVLSSSQSPIVLNASYTLPAGSASALGSVVESRAQQANIRQTIEAFNFSTTSYDQLNQQVLPTTLPDTFITSTLNPPANYIGAGNEVRLKISYKAVGPILSYPWQVFIDEATLRFVP